MKNNLKHIPVLLNESTDLLDLSTVNVFLDATLGFSGHAQYILSKLPKEATFFGIDQDPVALDYSHGVIGDDPRVSIINGNFSTVSKMAKEYHWPLLDACLVDCGVSSVQLDSLDRGFSFQTEGVLDMRMSPDMSLTASDVLNRYSYDELHRLFTEYGECRGLDSFIQSIIQTRQLHPLRTVPDLIQQIKKGFYFNNKRSNFIKMCTKVFQALRIEVNSELRVISDFLEAIPRLLRVGGRCSIITFHSLEDRLVKRFIRENKDRVQAINKKVIQLTYHQAKKNPRARSAKCRVFERLK